MKGRFTAANLNYTLAQLGHKQPFLLPTNISFERPLCADTVPTTYEHALPFFARPVLSGQYLRMQLEWVINIT